MKIKLLIIIALSLVLTGCANELEIKNDQENIFAPQRVKIGSSIINVELAKNQQARAKGLSNRTDLEESSGMLFIFDNYQVPGFWMKDMLFSIDIIWLAGEEIVGIENSVSLATSTDLQIYYPPQPVNRVLEVKAGLSKTNGWQVGDKVEYE